MLSHSVMFDSVTPWTVVLQDPLPLEFSSQEYWSGLSFPTSMDLPNPQIELLSPVSPAFTGKFFATNLQINGQQRYRT